MASVPAVQEPTLVQLVIGSWRHWVVAPGVQLAAFTHGFGHVVWQSLAPGVAVQEGVAVQPVHTVWQAVATPTVKGEAGDWARGVQEATLAHGLAAAYWHCRVAETVQALVSTQGLGHVVWHSVALWTVKLGPDDCASGVQEATLNQTVQGVYWHCVVALAVQLPVAVKGVQVVVHCVVALGVQVVVLVAVVQVRLHSLAAV